MDLWNFINDKFSAGIPVVFLCVLNSEDSSPGRQGFKMAVAADGHLYGSIGGGIMEHKFVEMAKDHLLHHKHEAKLYRQVHNKLAGHEQSGMICSGEQTLFIYSIQRKDLVFIQKIISSLKMEKNGTLLLSANGIAFSDAVPLKNFAFTKTSDDFEYMERTGFKQMLHIIGGGHCSLALSRIMHEMDFYIQVYDEREGLNTMEENIYAHKKTIVASYSHLSALIKGGENVYVVVMSFGYRTDDIAVRALLNKNFRYFGILGSKNKIRKMFDTYKMESVSELLLSRLHAPIGVQIKSQSPSEIAVSIAAEIIGVKNGALAEDMDPKIE